MTGGTAQRRALVANAVSAALVVIGLAGGTALDARPPRDPVVRGGYRVLEADFHAHTRLSDGFLSPLDIVLQARRRGLDALAVTEHNTVAAARIAQWFSGRIGGPAILVGEEITTRRYHLHGIGLTRTVRAGAPLREVLDDIHAQGGVAIAAHPVKRFWPAFEAELERIDAAEVMHPLAFGGDRRWRWAEMPAFYEASLQKGHRLTAIGSSDYHFGSILGVCRTLVFSEDTSADAVLSAVRKGRTVVFDLQGNAYGDPAMIALLRSDPYPTRVEDYGYRGSGLADRITRALGWLGVIGIVVFGMRKRGA